MNELSPIGSQPPELGAMAPTLAKRRDLLGLRDLRLLFHPGFNLQMLYGAIAILIFSAIGCRVTQVHVPNAANMELALFVAAAILLPLFIWLRERNKTYFVDLITVIFWAIFFAYMLNFPAEIGARIGSHFPLRDHELAQFDQAVYMPIPMITEWASHHWFGRAASATYFWLFPFMRIAILLPPLLGRAQGAKKFLTANLVMFALGIPLFAFFPAVGPWYGYHSLARPDQIASQDALLFLRRSVPCEFLMPTGIICFPSFHVVWAILCVYALWSFKLLRVPASILTALIIMSTVTTGEHYLLDLVAGALIAIVSILCAEWLARLPDRLLPHHEDSQLSGSANTNPSVSQSV